jgi:glycosyltransferase involved in cell wall biosynthesis
MQVSNVEKMNLSSKAYSLLIVSPVPVSFGNGQYQSIDLWVKDLEANLDFVSNIAIIAPQASEPLESSRQIPSAIKVIFQDQVSSESSLENLIKQYDVVSIGVGGPAWRMKTALKSAEVAKRVNRCLITSITSNRAKTTQMNSQGKNWLKKLKAKLVAFSIQRTTMKLVNMANGVVVVGEGVRKSMKIERPNTYVETASWINEIEIISESAFEEKISNLTQLALPRTIIATRLEPMKGVDLAIEALKHIKKMAGAIPTLSILGKGPLLEDLDQKVKNNHLQNIVSFDGVRTYPDEFFAELKNFELVLLTNLNEEQPRLIFDAISQGLIPICPDSAAYLHLQLPAQILYKKGDANSLALRWLALCDTDTIAKLMRQLRPMAFQYTINVMHQKRSSWMANLLASTRT